MDSHAGMAAKPGRKPAFNPYLPGYEYIPDGEPYVFGDRVYVFGSHDESGGTKYCPGDYVCWSAPVDDLGNWRKEGTIYRKEQDPANRDGSHALFAPDVAVGPDGRYYLYYGLDFTGKISVAVCDTPAGRYEYLDTVHVREEDGTRRDLTEGIPFDPAVLVDNDGRIFLYYGFCPHFPVPWVDRSRISGCMVVELNPDMVTVKEPPKKVLPCFLDAAGTGFENHAYFEAPSIRKINGLYYLVYASQQVHELCYATSRHPDRDFKFRGVIISNGDIGYRGRKPEDRLAYTANNHGGLVKIRDQWYIFYHRHTQGTQFSRQGCAEPVNLLEDGTIPQVEMTSCGLNGGPLPANGVYPAHIACNLVGPNGACMIEFRSNLKATEPYIDEEECGSEEHERNQYIANITSGTRIGFKYFAFDGGLRSISLRLRGRADGTISLRADDFAGEVIGEGKIFLDSDQWTDVVIPSGGIEGTHGLFIVYTGDGYLDLDSFAFLNE